MAISKTVKTVLFVLGGIVGLFLLGLIALSLALGSANAPHVGKNSVLVLRVTGEISDYRPEDPTIDLFNMPSPTSLEMLTTQLRKARVDERIGGVILDIDSPSMGWAKAEELRDSVKEFQNSGKPVFAFMETGGNLEYFLATAAEKIFLAPAGDLYINGLVANAMFYRGSLDKLGVEPEVIQIGKYKNAPDQYTRKDMSDPQREVINAILDEYMQRMTDAIASSRKLDESRVREIIDEAPFHADSAKDLGLIDGALYREQAYEQMRLRLGYPAEGKLKTVKGSEYKKVAPESLGLNNGAEVAVIYASGQIVSGSSTDSPLGDSNLGSDSFVKSVNDAAGDPSIKAIVIRVDSPGGSALASDIMWQAIENAKLSKPVVVSMADVAASGGYYISCNANKIVAQQTTLTGSIGVFMGKPVVRGLYDWLGISNEYVLRGKNAGILRETERWTPSERAKMQAAANKIYYTDFVPKVAKGRAMNTEAVNQIGQGHVWTGSQAKANGLVDEIGGLERAISIAKELAGIPADQDVDRINYPGAKSFFEDLFGRDDSAQSEESVAERAIAGEMPDSIRRAFRIAKMFEQMGRGESMLITPFILEIR